MNLEELKIRANIIEDEFSKVFENISDFIFKNPELGGEEYISSNYLVNTIKEYGFKTEFPYCNIDTAFRAEFGDEDGPVIAFLAEYDALPGYGENNDENAHACGHNWISAGTLGAAVVLSKLKEHFKGKIVLIGTPSEETVGAKCDMVKSGAFDDIDVVFQMHLSSENQIHCSALAIDSIEFTFEGVAAHAAAFPEKGINALDAVNLTFAGINALRQHLKSDVRIHGIITNGGQAPNIVPEKAMCKFYIRSAEREYLNEVTKKVINCAKGAELMTGAILTYRYFENSFDNIINNSVLQDIMKRNLIEVGIIDLATPDTTPQGSTDIGNVSHVCPTMYTEISLDIYPTCYAHEKEFLKYSNSMESNDKLHKSIKSMVGASLELYLNSDLLRAVKEEYNKKHKS